MRAVVALHDVADLPLTEVAAAVGRSENTVKSQLREARARLRRALRGGDFSATTIVVRDPLTGQPFPGNVIPADRLNPVALNIMGYYPVPTAAGPTGINNYTNQAKTDDTKGDGFIGKIDHQVTQSWTASGSYVFGKYYIPTANTLGSKACCTSASAPRAAGGARSCCSAPGPRPG